MSYVQGFSSCLNKQFDLRLKMYFIFESICLGGLYFNYRDKMQLSLDPPVLPSTRRKGTFRLQVFILG
jgi:hypothetical protein